MSERRRSSFVLLIVVGLIGGSIAVVADQADQARPGPPGRRPARLPGASRPRRSRWSRRGAAAVARPDAQRVDAFGVSEPELLQSGNDQIEVNLPGVTDAERGRRRRSARRPSCSSTTGRRTSSTTSCKTNPDQNANNAPADRRAARPRSPQASKCTSVGVGKGLDPLGEDSRAASRRPPPSRASTSSTRRPRSRSTTTGSPFDSREQALESVDREEAHQREILEVPAGVLVLRAEPTTDDEHGDPAGPLVGHPGPPGPARHGHQEPGAELRTRTLGNEPIVTFNFTRPGPQGVPGDHAARSPSAAPTTRSAATRSDLAALRDRARQRAGLDAVHQLAREPRRHRRLDRRADLRQLHDQDRPGPRRRSSRSAPCR